MIIRYHGKNSHIPIASTPSSRHSEDFEGNFMRTFTTEDIPIHIDALTAFIGAERIKKSVATWRNSIANSPPLVRAHQRRESFYWWPGFASYWDSQTAGTTYVMETLLLAKDATKVLDVLDTMPASIKGKYAGALGDVRNAPTHLFEISMAHHFMSFGYKLQWIENTGRGIPEFIVVTPSLEFEVECKHMSVDAGRLVSREEFSRFGALVEAPLRKRHVMGSVRVMLNERLPKSLGDLEQIAATIGTAIDAGTLTGSIEFAPWGAATIKLSPANDAVIDWDATQALARSAMPLQGHVVVHAQEFNDRPVNPISLTLETVKRDEYLKAMYDTMKDAAKRQLSRSCPGLLCVHIPEINDFASLLEESSLRNMTAYFFSKECHDHVCAVGYSSDTRIISEPTGYQFTADALAYKNAYCRFPGANELRLFSRESTPPEMLASELKQMQSLDAEERARHGQARSLS